MRPRLLGLVLLFAASLAASGCFLRFMLAHELETATSIGESVSLYIAAVTANSTVAICDDLELFPNLPVTCRYLINGEEIASTARLVSELGLFGVIVDPLVMELPAAATNITGTYDDGAGRQGSLLIYPGLSYVPVDDARTLTPAAGKQLVIADLPDAAVVNGVTYQFSLGFEHLGPRGAPPTQVKSLLAGKVIQNGKTYYPPMLPCVTSFTAVPSMTIPRSTAPAPVVIPAATGCTNAFYGYFRHEVGPSMACDLDNDHDIDRNDVTLIMAVRNRPAAIGDPRDMNDDLFINADDARVCTLRCTRARCN